MSELDVEALVNHWLAEAADDDLFLFVRYPPNLHEIALTKRQILRLNPVLLPDPPKEPPPTLPPPPKEPDPPNKPLPADTEELAVAVQDGVSVRGGPSTGAPKVGPRVAIFNAVVEVEKRIIDNGGYRWSVLKAINGSPVSVLAYVARGRTDGSEAFLVKAAAPA